jgi:hypothetical protein
MKKMILIIASLIFTAGIYSQPNSADLQTRGMVFIPQGSFEMNMTRNSETRLTHVSVEAFWMSNEITNGEYKEFVDWAKANPDKQLFQMKISAEVVTDPKSGSTKDTMIVKLIPISVSSFNTEMIDPLALEKVNKEFKGYFTDTKYSEYPVVGVSFRMAEYYCLWKSLIVNELMKEKGQPIVHSYRIPLETEWEYAAQKQNPKEEKDGLISKVNAGNPNEYGLFHLSDNVSEWVSSRQAGTVVVRGGSWMSVNSISKKQLISPDSKEPYIGFRIVQSYMAPQN